jgi:chemotaxis protein MotA
MDIGSILGMIFGFAFIAGAIMMHGSLSDFVDVPGALVAFGGSFSAIMIAFPAKKVLGIFGIVKQVFLTRIPDPKEEIQRFAEMAGVVRRDGQLALEKYVPVVKDGFLKRGLEMVIDNAPKDKVEEVLHIELHGLEERHALGKKIFDQLGAMLPSFGMVGTLVGLIQMLGQLDDPSKIGAGMAVAMVTTFYGAFVANMVFLPMGAKLEARSKEEVKVRELMIHGLVCLLEQESPREVESKLKAFLAPKARETSGSAPAPAHAAA